MLGRAVGSRVLRQRVLVESLTEGKVLHRRDAVHQLVAAAAVVDDLLVLPVPLVVRGQAHLFRRELWLDAQLGRVVGGEVVLVRGGRLGTHGGRQRGDAWLARHTRQK